MVGFTPLFVVDVIRGGADLKLPVTARGARDAESEINSGTDIKQWYTKLSDRWQ
jgi:hypothetical protein